MKKVALFDLGDTLVNNYRPHQFPPILQRCVARAGLYLDSLGLSLPTPEVVQKRVGEENHEAPDWKVRPLAGRLSRIFDFDLRALSADEQMSLCRAFCQPIFEEAWRYPDTIPTLELLREKGLLIGLISNTTWGAPGLLWREEAERHGIAPFCEHMVFCADVGWRKPARQIFDRALSLFAVEPEVCFMVGDLIPTDIVGARGVGISGILIDRLGEVDSTDVPKIRSLDELWAAVEKL